jgi:DNA-binding CsgD family transcriptional regulator
MMDRLKSKDFDEIINLMQLCPASPRNSDDTNRLFLETQRIFNSDELVFLYPNSRTSGIDIQRSFSLQRDRTFLSQYADYFWQYDPLYKAELSSGQNALAFRTEDVVPFDDFVKLKYYCDFLEPQNLCSELVMRLSFKSYFLGAISLLRSKDRPPFDENDVRKAELLIPYIASTIDVGDIFFKHLEEQRLFEQWLESQSEGIILLDANYHTLYFNSRAELLCSQINGRKMSLNCIADPAILFVPDIIIQDCRCLIKSHQYDKLPPRYDNRIINLKNQKRFHIQYFMFSLKTSETFKPSFVIVVNDLSNYAIPADEIIVGQAKLSHQEAVVARYAGMGWTNNEIADKIHSSPFTIQNQLKRVFEKTGLKNRTQLANLMKFSNNIDII